MDANYEKEYLIAEQTHPWFVCRRELIYQLIRTAPKNARILEVGCGSGINLLMLKNKGFTNLTGIEPSKGMKKDIGIPIFDSLDLLSSKFDLILILDVLEHIPDDGAMLYRLEQILAETGKIIITVPAFKFLWSSHDILNKHYRRYDKKMLCSAVKKTQLKMIRSFYWNFLFFFPIALAKVVKRKSTRRIKSDITPLPKYVSLIYRCLLRIENQYTKMGFNFPFGVSLVSILKKETIEY